MRPVDYAALTERRCSACKAVKPVREFGKYDDPKRAADLTSDKGIKLT